MNFSEIGLKDLVLDFDSNDLQDITIVQGDTKTRGFKVLVSTNNGEIIKASSQYEMRLYGINSNYPDKSFFTKGVIDGDFYKVYISTDMASKSGKLQLQLALFEGTNALIQSRIKEVDVYASIANGGNVGKDLVVDFGKLKDALDIAEKQQKKFDESLVRQQAVESQIAEKHTEVVQIRDGLKDVLSTENARVEAEKKRVSAEDVRASNESTRQSNEATRQSNETARQQNESTRTSQETQRQAEESTRKSEEQKRISAESSRNSEETKRDNAEKIRIENENKRVSAENTRAENDSTYNKNEEQRQSQESTRQTQEQQRIEAEKLRQSQEDTRVSQESTRQSQESTRQSQEQSRVDAESKRATSETTREQSEQTRNTKETERQNAEQTRQSNENTRQQQESSRVEAENSRQSTFDSWDKTMKNVIESEHLHIAYANSADGSKDFSTTKAEEKAYIGTYTDYEKENSEDYKKYTWMLVKGKDGVNGKDGAFTGEIGARNLIINSDKITGWAKSDGGDHLITDEYMEEFNIQGQRIKSDVGYGTDFLKSFVNFDCDNLVPGKTYTFSIYVKNNRDVTAGLRANGFNWNFAYELNANECKRFVVTGKRDNMEGYWKNRINFQLRGADKSQFVDMTVARPQLEEGDVATSWSKNPSDFETDISNLQSSISKKADKKHTHAIADVDGLQNELAQKASNNDLSNVQKSVDEKADKSHKHSIADITDLQTKLDEKANVKELSKLGRDMLYKVSSDTVKNIFIIEKGASTTNIPANTLIFEKE